MSSADTVEELSRLRDRLREFERVLTVEQAEKSLLREISDAPDLPALLEILARALRPLTDYHGCLINLIDEPRDNLICEHITLPDELTCIAPTYLKFHFPLHLADPNVEAYRERAPRLHDRASIHAFPSATCSRFDRWGMNSVLIVPIRASNHAVGTVMLFRTEGEFAASLGPAVEAALAPFVQPICRAVFHRNLKDKEHALNTALNTQKQLLRFIAQINSLTSTETIYDMISREFLQRFPFDMVGMFSLQNDELRLRKISVASPAYAPVQQRVEQFYRDVAYKLDPTEGATATVFVQNSPLYFNDVATIVHLPMSPKDRGGMNCFGIPRTFFILPIRHNSEPIGVLWLTSMQEPANLTDESRELIDLLCSFVGTAMTNAELYTTVGEQKKQIERLNSSLQDKVEELRQLASRDKLTGLSNFGAFEAELLRRTTEYARDTQRNRLSVVLIDVDHFKRFNDTYGHLAGNICLQEIARRINRAARTMDVPCRYGGEEFAVILPKCDLEGARVFGERLRALIADAPIQIGQEEVPVTISVGAACYQRGEDKSLLVERADRALYLAKQNGRNRVSTLDA